MNPQEVMEKARQLRAAGVPVAEIEQYIQSKLGQQPPAEDVVEVEAGYPERLATTLLQGAQVIPGMKSFQAAMGSLGSKFTDTPVSYADAKAGLDEQTDRMGGARKFAAQAVSAPVMAPVMAARGVSALSPMAQGAAYGAASEALDFNPDEALESRLLRAGVGGVAGGALAGAGSGVVKLLKAPPGTVKRVLGSAAPRNLQRATRTWRTINEAASAPIEKPQIRLNEASAPKAEGLTTKAIESLGDVPVEGVIPIRSAGRRIPIRSSTMQAPEEAAPTLEGLLGNAESVSEAGRFVTPRTLEDALGLTPERMGLAAEGAAPKIGDIVRNASPFKQQGAPKARFDWYAERQAAQRAAQKAPATEAAEPTLEDLLSLSLEHMKKGGNMRQLNEVASKARPK